jgi:hypothetical protein
LQTLAARSPNSREEPYSSPPRQYFRASRTGRRNASNSIADRN